MSIPDDPVAFVAEAERISNQADVAALRPVFADDAVLESTADGVFERYRGAEAVLSAWTALLRATKARRQVIRKRVLTVGDDTIVNDYEGTMGSRPVRGIESWRFDAEGKVCEHRVYSTLSARPSSDLRALLRLGANYPLTALRILYEQRRSDARRHAS